MRGDKTEESMVKLTGSAVKPTERRAAMERMARHGVRPNRRLGQNFLMDASTADRIAALCPAGPDDLVIEIGPGMGALTLPLSRRAGHVLAVEIDRGLMPILREVLEDHDNVTVERADFLQFDLSAWLGPWRRSHPEAQIHIAANVPYYITTPILRHVFSAVALPRTLVFLVQKEAAARLVAGPGSGAYGPLGASLGVFYTLKTCFRVPPHAFFPQPGVDSAVVQAVWREESESAVGIPPEGLLSMADAAFSHRRKRLANSLETSGWLCPEQKDLLSEVLCGMGLDDKVRAEELRPEQYATLYRRLSACEEGS